MFIIGDLKNGGAERAMVSLISHLQTKYKIILVLCDKSNMDYHVNVPIIEIPYRPLFRIIALRILKKKYKIDTAISFLANNNINNVLSKRKENTIISVRNYTSYKIEKEDKGLSKLRDTMIHKLALRYADVIVNVSKSVENDNEKNYHAKKNKMKTIYNYCDIDLINRAKKEPLNQEMQKFIKGKRVLITAGRFCFQKGIWNIIRAFPNILKEERNLCLLILGRGPHKEYYQYLINELHMQEYIKIIEFDSNPYKYFSRSSIFILNSFYEGLPNVILEAMACHLPIVASDCYGGTKEILSSSLKIEERISSLKLCEYGILYPVCEQDYRDVSKPLTKGEENIVQAILMLLKNKKLYAHYQKQSLLRVQDFTKDTIITAWMDII